MRHRVAALVALAITAVALAAVGGASADTHAGAKRVPFPTLLANDADRGTTYEVLIDVSCDESPMADETLRGLLDRLMTLAAWREGLLRIGTIRTSAQARLQFQTIGPFKNRLTDVDQELPILRGLQRQRDAYDLDALVARIKSDGSAGCRRDIGTDLIQAMQELGEDLKTFRASPASFRGGPMRLYIVTNGITVTRAVNFRLPQPSADVRVSQLKAAGRVPNLRGATIVLAGIGKAENISTKKVAWLRDFWNKYVTAAGVLAVATARDPESLITAIDQATG